MSDESYRLATWAEEEDRALRRLRENFQHPFILVGPGRIWYGSEDEAKQDAEHLELGSDHLVFVNYEAVKQALELLAIDQEDFIKAMKSSPKE